VARAVGRGHPALGRRGYRTKRLEALLDRKPGRRGRADRRVRKDVERLKELAAEVQALDRRPRGRACSAIPSAAEAESVATNVREARRRRPPVARVPAGELRRGAVHEVAVSAVRAAIAQAGRNTTARAGGKSGIGKTHLLHALGLELAKKPKAIVACLSTQDFIASSSRRSRATASTGGARATAASRRCC